MCEKQVGLFHGPSRRQSKDTAARCRPLHRAGARRDGLSPPHPPCATAPGPAPRRPRGPQAARPHPPGVCLPHKAPSFFPRFPARSAPVLYAPWDILLPVAPKGRVPRCHCRRGSASSAGGHAMGIISFLDAGKSFAQEDPHPSQLSIDPSHGRAPPRRPAR